VVKVSGSTVEEEVVWVASWFVVSSGIVVASSSAWYAVITVLSFLEGVQDPILVADARKETVNVKPYARRPLRLRFLPT
jgi:hypothetical protein